MAGPPKKVAVSPPPGLQQIEAKVSGCQPDVAVPANAPAQANPAPPPSSEPPTEGASTAEAKPPPKALPAKAEATTTAAAAGPPQPTADSQNPAAKKAKAEARRRELLAELAAVEQELGVPAFLERHGLDTVTSFSAGGSALHFLVEDMRLGQVYEETIMAVVREAGHAAVSQRSVPPFRPDGCTALHMACGTGGGDARLRCNLIRQMVELQADLTARDARGATPLLRAAGSNQVPVVRLLLQLRADPHEVHATTRRNAFDMANAAVRDILRDYGARATGSTGPSSRAAFPDRSRDSVQDRPGGASDSRRHRAAAWPKR